MSRILILDAADEPIRFYADGSLAFAARVCEQRAPMGDLSRPPNQIADHYEADPDIPADDAAMEADPRIVVRVDGRWVLRAETPEGRSAVLRATRGLAVAVVDAAEADARAGGFEWQGLQFGWPQVDLLPLLVVQPTAWAGLAVPTLDGEGVAVLETPDDVVGYAMAAIDALARLTVHHAAVRADLVTADTPEAVGAVLDVAAAAVLGR